MIEIQTRGFEYGVQHFLSSQKGTLHEVLINDLGLDTLFAEELINLGSVYVENQRTTQVSLIIHPQTYLRVHSKPRRYPLEQFHHLFQIIADCPDFVVLDKPTGLPVHATVDNLKENFQSLAESKLNQKLYVTHRLDVPTEGILIFAKNPQAQSLFNELLREKGVLKNYTAVLVGKEPPRGLWTHFMQPSPRAPKNLSTQAHDSSWQKCELELLEYQNLGFDTFEVRIKLLTGRTHQIRAQTAFMGCPVRYDHLYGAQSHSTKTETISLCSQELAFDWKGTKYHFRKEKHWS